PVPTPLSRTICWTRSVTSTTSALRLDRTVSVSVGTEAIVTIRSRDRPSRAGRQIMADVSRDLPVGNGALLINFDRNYQLRDIYYPRVGQENHTSGELNRFGIWVDGRFAWLDDHGWSRDLVYLPDTLVTNVTLRHQDLALSLTFNDALKLGRVPQGQSATAYQWLIAARNFADLQTVADVITLRGPEAFLERTRSYWKAWVNKENREFADLSPRVVELYRRCLLVVRSQVDSGGAVLAANDADI